MNSVTRKSQVDLNWHQLWSFFLIQFILTSARISHHCKIFIPCHNCESSITSYILMSQDIYNIELKSWFNHGCQNALEGVEQYLESLGERCCEGTCQAQFQCHQKWKTSLPKNSWEGSQKVRGLKNVINGMNNRAILFHQTFECSKCYLYRLQVSSSLFDHSTNFFL